VQIGSASELFERPAHTFVGHFIGSPGVNFLPVQRDAAGLTVAGIALQAPAALQGTDGALLLGVRPEYVALAVSGAPGALPAIVMQAQDIGTYWLVTATSGDNVIRARLSPDAKKPSVGDDVWLNVLGSHTCFYKDEELIA